jgi:hypothetical protein
MKIEKRKGKKVVLGVSSLSSSFSLAFVDPLLSLALSLARSLFPAHSLLFSETLLFLSIHRPVINYVSRALEKNGDSRVGQR